MPNQPPQPNPTPWRSVFHGNVLAMGLVSLFTDAASEMIYPLLPVFFTGLVPIAAAAVYVGLMEGIAESTAALLKIASGRYSDRLQKRKPFALAGYGLSTLARSAIAFATAGWHPVALRFADRVGKGLRTAPRDALLADSVDPRVRSLAFSFHRAMDHAGAVLGPLAAIAFLFAFLGYALWKNTAAQATPDEMHALRYLFAFALLPGLVSLLVLKKSVREVPPKPRDNPANPSGRQHQSGLQSGLPGRFYAFVAAATLFALGNSSDLFLVFYARTRFHLGLLHVLALWITLHLAKIAFSFPGGYFADKLGKGRIIIAGWAVYALVYLAIPHAASLPTFYALLLAYGLYYGLTEGVEKALVASFIPSHARGYAYGLYHGATGLAALPASLIFGLFFAKLGPTLAFSLGAALAAAATLALATLLLTTRNQPQPNH